MTDEKTPANVPRPSICRMVIYTHALSDERPNIQSPAVVHSVPLETSMECHLIVLAPTKQYFLAGVPYADPPVPHSWRWPWGWVRWSPGGSLAA